MTIQAISEVIANYDAVMASRALPFDVSREAESLLANPDEYSMSHLTEEQQEAVLRAAYNL